MLRSQKMPQQLTKNYELSPDRKDSTDSGTAHFLVCGLGSLGQYCVAKLKEFDVTVSAIDVVQPNSWEIASVPDLLTDLVFGDCRQPDVLGKAKIQQCRAVLLVTSNERVNIDAAFAVRVINPQVRLVVRSSKQNLNQLLDRQLGNFEALEATQLPAAAFAIAALGSEIQGFFQLGDRLLRVVEYQIDAHHRWCDRRLLHELNSRTRRILSHIPNSAELPTKFYQWEPDTRIRAGDIVAYIEVSEGLANSSQPLVAYPSRTKTRQNFSQFWQKIRHHLCSRGLQQMLTEVWQSTAQQQTQRVAMIVGITVLTLIVLGTSVLKAAHPQESWLKTLYVTSVMLLGSYDIVFGALSPSDPTPLWMRLMNLSYMLAGTASIAVLYALLTESLLAAKFQLLSKRPPIPQQDHVVLVGLDRVGRQVATFLQQLKQPLVGVSNVALEPSVLPQMPLMVSDLTNTLTKVNLATAKSVVVATDDEMANLEIGLMAHAANPDRALVIRTFDPRFSNNLARLLPHAEVLCIYALAAEAFAAAAFGENILNLFRLNEQTILVAEYNIQAGEPFCGMLLAEVAYGYGMVPILYQESQQASTQLMPSDHIRLEVGDRLVVLVTVESLQRIERGEILPRNWQVQVDKILTRDAVFDGARAIARISGCEINTATELMHHLPGVLPPLYKHQAQRLVRELSKVQTLAHLIPFPSPEAANGRK